MTRFRASALLLALAAGVASTGCWPWSTGPSGSVTGNWSAQGTGHSSIYQLSLTQQRDQVSGVACQIEGNILVFGSAPVMGDYPKVVWSNRATFVGKYEEGRDQIAGDYGSTPLRFNRSVNGHCEGAKPLLTIEH